MNEKWLWIGKYLVVIIVALVLGAVLGDLEPFHGATVGGAHLSAGGLVQFIAQTGALALLWTLGLRISVQLRASPGRSAALANSALALVSLVVVASFYGVLLRFINPFMAQNIKPLLDWSFIGAILVLAGWLLWALFVDFEAFLAAFTKGGAPRSNARRTA
jgi:hypothetical protein